VAMDVVAVQHASGPDRSENRAAIDRTLRTIGSSADLVVFPEASHRAFGEPAEVLAPDAEPLDGPFVEVLARASSLGPTIVAGMFEVSEDPSRPYNTTVVLSGGVLVGTYRKIHLYDALGFVESSGVTPGPPGVDSLLVVDVADVAVGIQTCFDLRFPEMSAALVERGAQVLALGAAWVPGPRKVEQWGALLAARAIETTSFVVAAAQPGPRYSGHSSVVAPTGELLATSASGASVIRATVDPQVVKEVRAAMPVVSSRRLGRG